MKEDNSQSNDSRSKRTEKSHKPQVRAFLAYKKVKQIRDNARERLEKQGFFTKLEKEVAAVLKKENLDEEALHWLGKMEGIDRPMTETEKLDYVAKKTVSQYLEQMAFYEEHRIPLILSSLGDLYRKPKEQYCYPMRGGLSKRLLLLRILLGVKAFYHSEDLLNATGYEDYKTMTDAIKEINEKTRKKLQLPKGEENKLIISRSHTGYMINPMYPITLED